MRILSLVVLVVCRSFSYCYSQPQEAKLEAGYYLIVGAFAVESNAVKYCAKLNQQKTIASLGHLKSKGIYYVYTLISQDKFVSIRRAAMLRQNPEFWDAWVKYIDERNEETIESDQTVQNEPILLKTDTSILLHKQEVLSVANTSADSEAEIQEPIEIFLSLYNSTNDRVVDGKVKVINPDKEHLISEVQGNAYLNLPDPNNNSGKLILICDVLGYRKVQHEIIGKSPLTDSTADFVKDIGSSLVINFELTQYQKGDIRSLYDVYFYNDASIMRPESKFELNELLAMMKGNLKYKIRLHGHTNGNFFGKIIRPGPSNNLFSITKDSQSSLGSAKKLAYDRATAIHDYLVSNGITGDRIEVKSWGGKRPLYKKDGLNARRNVRVEVEIVEN